MSEKKAENCAFSL